MYENAVVWRPDSHAKKNVGSAMLVSYASKHTTKVTVMNERVLHGIKNLSSYILTPGSPYRIKFLRRSRVSGTNALLRSYLKIGLDQGPPN